ncbi:MAG: hypothetical protein GEV03_22215 [Streptosporangiales bacterium]|nr:hypothetical protein [Streptosporangiales bacterium]
MSIAVMNWVWAHSPTSGNHRLVLLAIADACSHDNGTGAWPAVDTIRRKARITDRTARRVIADLERDGHLIVHRGQGPHRTNLYTVVIHNPCQCDSCQSVRGDTGDRGRGDTGDRGVLTQLCHPIHPEPPLEPPPPARTRDPVDNPSARSPVEDGGGEAEEVFTALGEAWPLSASQRARLTPAIGAALATGWRPRDLATHLDGNTTGVRNPYAVLRARLADLPDPPPVAPPRPPWCGHCHPDTRHIENRDGRPARCPACHPLTAGGEAE